MLHTLSFTAAQLFRFNTATAYPLELDVQSIVQRAQSASDFLGKRSKWLSVDPLDLDAKPIVQLQRTQSTPPFLEFLDWAKDENRTRTPTANTVINTPKIGVTANSKYTKPDANVPGAKGIMELYAESSALGWWVERSGDALKTSFLIEERVAAPTHGISTPKNFQVLCSESEVERYWSGFSKTYTFETCGSDVLQKLPENLRKGAQNCCYTRQIGGESHQKMALVGAGSETSPQYATEILNSLTGEDCNKAIKIITEAYKGIGGHPRNVGQQICTYYNRWMVARDDQGQIGALVGAWVQEA